MDGQVKDTLLQGILTIAVNLHGSSPLLEFVCLVAISVKNVIFLYIKSLGDEDANGTKIERPKFQLPKSHSS